MINISTDYTTPTGDTNTIIAKKSKNLSEDI